MQSQQLLADRDQTFADWGETITLSRVVQTFEPTTQQIVETATDYELLAIVGNSDTQPILDATGQSLAVDLVAQLKEEDFPAVLGDVTWKITHKEQQYDVIGSLIPAGLAVVQLACRKVA